MPATIRGVVINRNSGSFNLGDIYEVTPILNGKTYHGSGSSNVGYSINTFNGISKTNVADTDKSDQDKTFTL
ncbi:spore germination protein [Ectobacillus funiculus]|uniref:spore germination protein n=1 Tax=Ectobacillus funiculus TaxID=137993 RepID=UPI00101D606E|nr:spore germination protein [Ectobacillus funiculus]